MRFIIISSLLLVGCMRVERQGFSLTAVGEDIKGSVEYVRVDTNGNTEAFVFRGTKNQSESTHTVANMVSAVICGVIGGVTAGPGGAAAGASKGAAVGGATAEVWQTVKDWARKSGEK